MSEGLATDIRGVKVWEACIQEYSTMLAFTALVLATLVTAAPLDPAEHKAAALEGSALPLEEGPAPEFAGLEKRQGGGYKQCVPSGGQWCGSQCIPKRATCCDFNGEGGHREYPAGGANPRGVVPQCQRRVRRDVEGVLGERRGVARRPPPVKWLELEESIAK
jgi:hypothetical protein